MTKKERIYDAFGELLYLVAIADGIIQPEEEEALKAMLKDHPKADQITWSFNYEAQKKNELEDIYKKVIDTCHDNGPDPEYQSLMEMMGKLAAASAGVDPDEKHVMDGFVHDLTERFKKDLEKINEG